MNRPRFATLVLAALIATPLEPIGFISIPWLDVEFRDGIARKSGVFVCNAVDGNRGERAEEDIFNTFFVRQLSDGKSDIGITLTIKA